jgi:hypothetical protein
MGYCGCGKDSVRNLKQISNKNNFQLKGTRIQTEQQDQAKQAKGMGLVSSVTIFVIKRLGQMGGMGPQRITEQY